jgi:extracellular elastinolytic metalloproteinase
MGEGWGDMISVVLKTKKTDTRNTVYLMGAYVYNGKTIRQYPYSTSMTTNPETYASVAKYSGVHNVGAIWATILNEVYWNLIEKHGFSADLISGAHTAGNTLFLRLLLDGMKLQPCSPTLIQARDAILLADTQLTGGANKCEIWKGFAKRGLGVNASGSGGKYVDGKNVPQGC